MVIFKQNIIFANYVKIKYGCDNMGFLKDATERFRMAKEEQEKKSWYVCPECCGTMKPVVVQLGGSFRDSRVRCQECGYTLAMKDAKATLEQPK